MGMITAHYGVEGGGFYGIPLASTSRTSLRAHGTRSSASFGSPPPGWRPDCSSPRTFAATSQRSRGSASTFLFGALAGRRPRLDGRPMAERHAQAARRHCGSGSATRVTNMSISAVSGRRLCLIGLLLWLFLIARSAIPALRRRTTAILIALYFCRPRPASRCSTAPGCSGACVASDGRRILAMVGRASLGRRLLRGLRHGGHRLPVRPAGPDPHRPRPRAAVLFSATIFLTGGIIGTFHHLYFAGTPTVASGLGSVFSALEVVPLVLVGFEAYENLTSSTARPWVRAVQVADLFLRRRGVLEPGRRRPVRVHDQPADRPLLHAGPEHDGGPRTWRLFGVYGMLGLGLMLFCLRAMNPELKWKERSIGFAFWAINIGMLFEILLSLLPIGLLQTYQSVSVGYWSARSPEFMQTSLMQTLRWMRLFGDTIFATGTVFRLVCRRSNASTTACGNNGGHSCW